jgi:acyl-CoA thioester hydrolase
VHVDIHYRKPARLGQTIEVTTEVIEMTHVTISLKHLVFLHDDLLVESTLKLACINSEGRPQRLPREFKKLRNEQL